MAPWCAAHDTDERMSYEVVDTAGHAERSTRVFPGCHDFVWDVEFAEEVAHVTWGHVEVTPYYEWFAHLCDASTDLGHDFPCDAGV